MLGAIIGDIVGSVYEWNNIKSKKFNLFSDGSFFTDDTVMTIAVAKSLIDCNGNYDNLSDITINNMVMYGKNYIDRGYGGSFYKWILSNTHEPYNSFGNGSAMRVSACGLISNSLEETKELAYKVTCITHNHPEGLKGAEAVAVAIYMARTGKSKEEIKKYIIDNYYNIDFTIDGIRSDYTFDVSCQGSVPQALEAFFESQSFEDAVRNAISIGGDSDTIAAIAGSVAAPYYGIDDNIKQQVSKYLPDEFIEVVNKFDEKTSKLILTK